MKGCDSCYACSMVGRPILCSAVSWIPRTRVGTPEQNPNLPNQACVLESLLNRPIFSHWLSISDKTTKWWAIASLEVGKQLTYLIGPSFFVYINYNLFISIEVIYLAVHLWSHNTILELYPIIVSSRTLTKRHVLKNMV